MWISKKKYERMQQAIKAADNTLLKQNKIICRLNDENKHLAHLLGLYEACLRKGVKVDFPGTDRKEIKQPGTNSTPINY